MRCYVLSKAFLFHLFLYGAFAQSIKGLFLFKDALKSNTNAIKTSGFNSVIIFGIGIIDNGDIMYYSNTPGSVDTLVASNGAYVGGTALSDKVKGFKTGTTGINRIEVSTNAQHIKDLVANPGTGSGTHLYKNFAALKAAWSLDAVNNDDESIYDINSSVAFAKMLGAIGLKYTIAPYTNINFWLTVKNQVGSMLDRVYLQCYDGGRNNNPSSWQNTLGIKVVPLVWVTNDSKPSEGTTASQAKTKFTNWGSAGTLAGGGYWNDYDIENMGLSYSDYGNVLKSVFP